MKLAVIFQPKPCSSLNLTPHTQTQAVTDDKKASQGFTLMELMIVMLFLSLFSVIALPNLLKQGGKAREVEFKNVIGTVNRAQQAYHWERKIFAEGADDQATLERLNVRFNNHYISSYNIDAHDGSIPYATIAPSNANYQRDQTRAYSGLTSFDNGVYATYICQSNDITELTPVPNLPPASICGTDAERIR
ncbi:type IV pilin-like G/H family protein [Gloeocapsa sp. PCC 73106]|uniref:type IV pilin-like G/H family protein n=1 Tax=Gloeocapsa sp. PCC 73106 TaxID=102232 RepID=UPI0002ACB30A|nr:type IV pilin-like G/H family protein [Gloeocapsa sp. PCC 73106]ELR98800.1 prepilin-type N-terminal cleavage/methylation domain-containing protein [Gloeocapsa sp. PCC 73106]